MSNNKENMEGVERIFNRYDTNGDGKISYPELADMLRALGSNPTEEDVKHMMKEIDKNGDGVIDLKEFAEFHRGDVNGDDGYKELKDAFDMYDVDKNGLISASELHRVMKSLGEKCSFRDCSRMIGNVDADGDGSVNFDEFKKMMMSNK